MVRGETKEEWVLDGQVVQSLLIWCLTCRLSWKWTCTLCPNYIVEQVHQSSAEWRHQNTCNRFTTSLPSVNSICRNVVNAGNRFWQCVHFRMSCTAGSCAGSQSLGKKRWCYNIPTERDFLLILHALIRTIKRNNMISFPENKPEHRAAASHTIEE